MIHCIFLGLLYPLRSHDWSLKQIASRAWPFHCFIAVNSLNCGFLGRWKLCHHWKPFCSVSPLNKPPKQFQIKFSFLKPVPVQPDERQGEGWLSSTGLLRTPQHLRCAAKTHEASWLCPAGLAALGEVTLVQNWVSALQPPKISLPVLWGAMYFWELSCTNQTQKSHIWKVECYCVTLQWVQ